MSKFKALILRGLNFPQTRTPWFLLMLLGLILEGCGLYFQYGLGLPPCVNCVYERALFLTFILAGFIGFIKPQSLWFRTLGALVLLAGSIQGILVTLEHLASYANAFGTKCALKANFPQFLKLDEWLPFMFQPEGTCGPLPWSLLGLNMPTWILLSFIGGVLGALYLLFAKGLFNLLTAKERKEQKEYLKSRARS